MPTQITRPLTRTGSCIRPLAVALAMVALLVTAPSALAGTPSGDGLGDMQELDVQASPPITGAGIIFDFQQTYWNTFGIAALRSPVAAVIHFPRGVVWNGPLFPQCEPAKLSSKGPAACPPGSRFATADVVAALGAQSATITAKVTDFVGTPLDGLPTQLLYVVPQVGPPFILTGVIRNEPSGGYGLAEDIDLTKLPGGTSLTPSPVVIVSIHNVDIHTSLTRVVNGTVARTPLIVAPPTCNGFWDYAFDSIYPAGPPLTSTTTQPCVPAPDAVDPSPHRPHRVAARKPQASRTHRHHRQPREAG